MAGYFLYCQPSNVPDAVIFFSWFSFLSTFNNFLRKFQVVRKFRTSYTPGFPSSNMSSNFSALSVTFPSHQCKLHSFNASFVTELTLPIVLVTIFCILSSIVCTLKNDDEILLACYNLKVVEKGLQIKWIMWCWERLAGWTILENSNNYFFLPKNHCKIKVHTILVCPPYSITIIVCPLFSIKCSLWAALSEEKFMLRF